MILLGDCLERLKELAENSVDAVVTDPPYGWRFMGKAWDDADIQLKGQQAKRPGETYIGKDGATRKCREDANMAAGKYDQSLAGNIAFMEWTKLYAIELLRVLKPGGHALIFCGPRTYHAMAMGVEMAGFEIRDQLQWLFGSGFPKSLNIEKQLERISLQDAYRYKGWGTALKPANEPIVLARKPLEKGLTVAENVLKWGVGGLNIDESRIGSESVESGRSGQTGFCTPKPSSEKVYVQGRWPANLLLDEQAAEMLDEQSGISKSSGGAFKNKKNIFQSTQENGKGLFVKGDPGFGDIGGASRFFYVAKTSKRERNAGLEGLEVHRFGAGIGQGKDPNAPTIDKNHHPTVKPIKLMEYLIKLITPKGGVVLDPFMGSGSTGVAAFKNGFKFIGIEMNEEYLEIAKRRIEHAKKDTA